MEGEVPSAIETQPNVFHEIWRCMTSLRDMQVDYTRLTKTQFHPQGVMEFPPILSALAVDHDQHRESWTRALHDNQRSCTAKALTSGISILSG